MFDQPHSCMFRPTSAPPGGGVPCPRPASFEGRLAFEGVAFTYPSRPDTTVLDNVDLELLPGQVPASPPTGRLRADIVQLPAPPFLTHPPPKKPVI